MNSNHRSSRSTSRTLVFALTGLVAAAAGCADRREPLAQADAGLTLAGPDVYLKVQAFQIPANTFANPAPITMWGFVATDSHFNPLPGALPQVPGPTLVAVEGTTLNVHLKNDLLGQPYAEPVSLVVPGQRATLTPVWFDPSTGNQTSTGARLAGDTTSRVRSFNAETPADASTVTTYTFGNLKAGTFLYQSGTHPAVQVQMGLYGPLKVYPTTARRAYADASSAFNNEVTLLFSEIDPDLHAAVAAGHYGPNPPDPAPADWRTSTIEYLPRYFLVNGRPFTPGTPIPAGQPNQRLLLRFLNAGLATKAPTVLGPVSPTVNRPPLYLSVIAEDANFITVTSSAGAIVPAPRQQYSLLLSSGKTMDAILTPSGPGNIPVFDRRMNLTNAGTGPGGQLVFLAVPGNTGNANQPLAAEALEFEAVQTTTQTRQLTITNTLNTARVINAVQISGAQGTSFSAAWSLPITVPARRSVTLPVSFKPPLVGAYAATLVVSSDDPNQPLLLVRMTGAGTRD